MLLYHMLERQVYEGISRIISYIQIVFYALAPTNTPHSSNRLPAIIQSDTQRTTDEFTKLPIMRFEFCSPVFFLVDLRKVRRLNEAENWTDSTASSQVCTSKPKCAELPCHRDVCRSTFSGSTKLGSQ